jgi:hypothetical protein
LDQADDDIDVAANGCAQLGWKQADGPCGGCDSKKLRADKTMMMRLWIFLDEKRAWPPGHHRCVNEPLLDQGSLRVLG